jgi:hypothetical protein
MMVDLNHDQWRYLSLLVKNRHNDMVTAVELEGVIETMCDPRTELSMTESLLKVLDPDGKAVYTSDYSYLQDP